MKFYKKTIVFQELPHEISLCYSITGCGKHCKGCHSPWLQSIENGENLTLIQYQKDIDNAKGYISAVVFLGGEWDSHFIDFLKVAQKNGLKTCLYSSENIQYLKDNKRDLLSYLDFVKTGSYIEELGGLTSPKTNQKFFFKTNEHPLQFTNITSQFWKEEK